MSSLLHGLLGAALLGGVARAAGPDHTREIATGVWYPWVQFGTCSDCGIKPAPRACCGTDLGAALPVWAAAQEKSGVVAIDTQLRYNWTASVAVALAPLRIPRDEIWITSKIDPKVFCDAADPTQTALAMIEETLTQLGVAALDLALLHEPCDRSGKPHPSDRLAWAGLMQALGKGLVRAIGVDKYLPAQMDALRVNGGAKPAVLMMPFGLSQHDDLTLTYCQQNGIACNAFGVMHGCLFDDPTVLGLATKYGASASQICAVWTRQRGCSMAVGIGMNASTMPGYTSEDLDIFRFNLSTSEVTALSALQHTPRHQRWSV